MKLSVNIDRLFLLFQSLCIHFSYYDVLCPSAHYGKDSDNGDNRHPCAFPEFNGIIFIFSNVYDVFCGLFVDRFIIQR